MYDNSTKKALNQRVQIHVKGGKEYWRDVPGYEGYYRVSDWGRVKSLARTVPMKDGRKYRVGEKLLKPAWDGHYLHVIFSRSGQETVNLVHRLVLEAFSGKCPEGKEARHLDGDAKNNKLKNLRWGTREQNVQDKVKHGTSKNGGCRPGLQHWNVRLTEDQVKEIRRRTLLGERPCHLCKEFNVNEATIRDIRNRKSWKHI